MEQIDIIITRMLNTATKKVEGMKRNIPYSKEKRKRRATVLYYKAVLRKMKGIAIDEEIMEKRRSEAKVENDGMNANVDYVTEKLA